MPFLCEVIEENNEHALEVALFTSEKEREHRQGQKNQPKPGNFGANEAEDQELKSA
jgi:hypothetical protein